MSKIHVLTATRSCRRVHHLLHLLNELFVWVDMLVPRNSNIFRRTRLQMLNSLQIILRRYLPAPLCLQHSTLEVVSVLHEEIPSTSTTLVPRTLAAKMITYGECVHVKLFHQHIEAGFYLTQGKVTPLNQNSGHSLFFYTHEDLKWDKGVNRAGCS